MIPTNSMYVNCNAAYVHVLIMYTVSLQALVSIIAPDSSCSNTCFAHFDVGSTGILSLPSKHDRSNLGTLGATNLVSGALYLFRSTLKGPVKVGRREGGEVCGTGCGGRTSLISCCTTL